MSRKIKLYRVAMPDNELDSEQFIHTMTEANKFRKDGWVVDEVSVTMTVRGICEALTNLPRRE
jgi:hypothetical protein|tara:strand:+ start:292 stop:480 length:189 start_codon:yes stop_codon:yes gene_type:complete